MQIYRISLFLLISIMSAPAVATETVRLQLKWLNQFQFAGYYAAKELGYYQDVGLDVEIIEAQPGTHSTKTVLRGDAEYGVGNSGLILSRNSGNPLVVLAVILQHSPFALVTQQISATDNIHDLSNKKLMLDPLADELVAYLSHEGITLDKFELVDHKHNVDKFIAGKVDAMSSYTTTEPFFLNKLGIKFNTYSPRSVGIDFYGDNLFTTESELKHHPERVRAFREASLRGWHYAMDHQAEIIDLIVNKYSTRHSRDFLAFEAAQMQKLMKTDLIDIGYMLKGRWQHIAETYASQGMLPDDFSLEGFLYDSNPKQDYFWFYTGSAITLFVLSIVIVINLRFSALNKQLVRLLHIKNQFSNIGESVNNISHQWKQPLNELGIQLMLIEQMVDRTDSTNHNKKDIKRITDKSHTLLEFMANTVDTFGHLLNTSNNTSSFSPITTIEEILYLVRDSFSIHKIALIYEHHGDIRLNGNSTQLSHVVLSILNNARDIILERNIESPHIQIKSYVNMGYFYIEISDNAGGIAVIPVDNIFKLGFSDKLIDDSGIGLYIAKKIITDNLNGTIHAENTRSGALFKIAMPCPDLNL